MDKDTTERRRKLEKEGAIYFTIPQKGNSRIDAFLAVMSSIFAHLDFKTIPFIPFPVPSSSSAPPTSSQNLSTSTFSLFHPSNYGSTSTSSTAINAPPKQRRVLSQTTTYLELDEVEFESLNAGMLRVKKELGNHNIYMAREVFLEQKKSDYLFDISDFGSAANLVEMFKGHPDFTLNYFVPSSLPFSNVSKLVSKSVVKLPIHSGDIREDFVSFFLSKNSKARIQGPLPKVLTLRLVNEKGFLFRTKTEIMDIPDTLEIPEVIHSSQTGDQIIIHSYILKGIIFYSKKYKHYWAEVHDPKLLTDKQKRKAQGIKEKLDEKIKAKAQAAQDWYVHDGKRNLGYMTIREPSHKSPIALAHLLFYLYKDYHVQEKAAAINKAKTDSENSDSSDELINP